jgi:RHS repeat-associated protein
VILEYVSAFGISAQMAGQTENSATVPLPGGVEAVYSGGTLKRFRFPDWQGTIRAESDPVARTFTESLAFAPFGERYAIMGAPYNVDSFTGQPDQITSDEYDFAARELHNGQGRWISPDPLSGTGNKYAYASNNPLNEVDIGGLLGVLISGVEYSDTLEGALLPGVETADTSESHPPEDVQNTAKTQAPGSDSSQQAPQQTQSSQQQSNNNSQPSQQQTPTAAGIRTLDPNSQECKDLAKKIDNIAKDVIKRDSAIATNPGALPEIAPPGSPLRASVDGHRQIMQQQIDNLGAAADLYNNKCGGGPPPLSPVGGFAPASSSSGGPISTRSIVVGIVIVGAAVALAPETGGLSLAAAF